MKKIILFLFLYFPLAALAQTYSLSGRVDVPYATIAITGGTDTLFKRQAVAGQDGLFKVTGLSKASYKLSVNAVGFQPFAQSFAIDGDRELPLVHLNEEVTQLAEVQVTSRKPTVVRKIDRVEFNVENTALSSTNAWEIVKRAPGVQSGGGELSIRGSKSILVTINDKKVYLTGDELKTFLEGTGGGDVKSVEVITNPPAKYEASGSAVINIRLKKNPQAGYKGSVNGSYTQGIYAKGNVGTSQYYKNGKFGVFGSYTFGRGLYYNEITEQTRYPAQNQLWEDVLKRKNFRDAEHSYRVSMDYAADSLNTISIGADGYIAQKNHALYLIPTIVYQNGQYNYSFDTRNTRISPRANNAINLTYEHSFSPSSSLIFAADLTNDHNKANQNISTTYNVAVPYTSRFVNNNDQRIRLFSTQLDYHKGGKLLDLETGLKYSNVKANTSQDFQHDLPSGGFGTDPELSNTFNYTETVLAGYIGLNKTIKAWSFKAGLRGEHTATTGVSVHPQEMNKQDYFNLFPTLFVQNKLSEENMLGLSYGRRITRPQYSYLNPSKSYFSPNSYLVGDAKLKPAITDQFSLNYTLKGNYSAEAYFIHEKNPTIQLPQQDNSTNILVQRVTNIPGNYFYGIDFSANVEPAAWWSVNAQAGPGHMESSFGLADGSILHNRAFTVNGNLDQQFTINKKAGLSTGINLRFTTAGVQGPARVSPMSSLNFSARKKFGDRAELSLLISDVYRGEKMTVSSDYAEQHNSFTYYGDTQNFRLSFKYNLGTSSLKTKAAKDKTSEQTRL
jgi:outer membrane receptor protein involved in Fe transport